MIRLTRTKEPPKDLSKASVLQETADALALFDPAQDGKPHINEMREKFKFDKYNMPGVKDALKEMCNHKCAYCESSFLHVYYGDIEHFRPKKFIGTTRDRITPGYYWLANEWDNFFLSCLFCNQSKKQRVMKNGVLTNVTIGKQNQFPFLTSKSTQYRVRRNHLVWKPGGRTQDEAARGLIDPCKDQPEKFFKYTKDGSILPRPRNKERIEKANHSIRVYALQRLYLVQERRKRYIELASRIASIRALMLLKQKRTAANSPAPVINDLEKRYMEQSEELFIFTHPKSTFSAMGRQFVHEFFMKEIKLPVASVRKLEEKIHARKGNDWFQL